MDDQTWVAQVALGGAALGAFNMRARTSVPLLDAPPSATYAT